MDFRGFKFDHLPPVIWIVTGGGILLATLAAIKGWTFSIGWRDLLTIVGLVIGLVGLREARNSRVALAQYRTKLHRQRGVNYFNSMADNAASLASSVRGRDWNACASIATSLAGRIASASTSWNDVLDTRQDSNLKGAATALRAILEAIPIAEENVENDTARTMRDQCVLIIYSLGELAGHITRIDELEEIGGERATVGADASLRP